MTHSTQLAAVETQTLLRTAHGCHLDILSVDLLAVPISYNRCRRSLRYKDRRIRIQFESLMVAIGAASVRCTFRSAGHVARPYSRVVTCCVSWLLTQCLSAHIKHHVMRITP